MAVTVPEEIKVDLPTETPQPAPRSFADIQQEFTNTCARAGHLEYQVFTFKKDLEILNNKMRELNLEAAAAQARELAEKQKEAANG